MDKYIRYKINTSINISKIPTLLYLEFDKDYDFSGESHDFWELVYVDKGEIIITASKEKIVLKQGEAYFHYPNQFHSIKANGQTAPNVFIISFVCRSSAMSYFKKNGHLKFGQRSQELIEKILEEGRPVFGSQQKESTLKEPVFGGQQMIKLYLEMLLITLIREDDKTRVFSSKSSLDNHITLEIKKILEENIYGMIDIQTICKQLNYGKTYLCHTFKSTTGKSIMKYYSELKIKEAKKLIREKRYNFTQISNVLMYNNPHYFSCVFKNITGMTPREYRSSIKPD